MAGVVIGALVGGIAFTLVVLMAFCCGSRYRKRKEQVEAAAKSEQQQPMVENVLSFVTKAELGGEAMISTPSEMEADPPDDSRTTKQTPVELVG